MSYGELKGQALTEREEKEKARHENMTLQAVKWGHVEKSKMDEYFRFFKKIDADLSGDLDLQEVKKMLEDMGQTKTHSEIVELIAEVDVDKSGTISFEEFLLMMAGPPSVKGAGIITPEFASKVPQNPVLAGCVKDGLKTRMNFFEEKKLALEREKEEVEKVKIEAQRRREAKYGVEALAKKKLEEEKKQKELEEKERAEKRAAFKAKQASLFEQK